MSDVAGELAVKVTADTTAAARGIAKDMDKAGAKAGESVGKKLALSIGAAFAAGKAFSFVKDSIGAASDLNESVNAVAKTFQKIPGAADQIAELGKTASSSYGMSQAAFNAFSVQMSGFAQQIAGPGGDVVGVIEDISGRVADFASVQNLSLSEASDLWRQSLAGETEAAKRFGIDVSDTAVKAYALANGIGTAGKELTQNEKVLARQGILMQKTANYAGDFADTADQVANKTRIATARFEDQKAAVGTALLPVMSALLDAVQPIVDTLMPKLADGFAKAAPYVTDLITFVSDHATAFTALATGIAASVVAIKGIREAKRVVADIQSLGSAFGTVVGKIGPVASAVRSGVVAVASYTAEIVKNGAAWVANTAKAAAGAAAQAATAAAAKVAAAGQWVLNAALAAAGWVKYVAQLVLANATQLAMATAAKVAAAGQWLLNAALSANPIGLVIAALAALVAAVVLAWKNSETFRNVVTGAWNAIKAGVAAVWGWFKSTLLPGILAIWNGIKAGISALVAAVRVYVSTWLSVFRTAMNAIRSAAEKVWGWIGPYVKGIMSAVKAVIEKYVGFWLTAFGKIRDIVGKVTKAFTDARDKVSEWMDKIKTKVETKVGEVVGKFRDAIGKVAGIGGDIVDGLWRGISGGWDWLVRQVEGLVGGLIQKIKDKLHIGSPSKVTEEIGGWTAAGFGIGWTDEFSGSTAPAVVQSVGSLVTSLSGIGSPSGIGGVSMAADGGGFAPPVVQVFIGNEQLDAYVVRASGRQLGAVASRLVAGGVS